ncbi:MAG: type II toxin-antitoxin system RelB/DinJ family antitoxin [Pyramidobacter sp.]|nr:type II toxin-antitoxin system RelB/DinJ family antitoxin [Pyramidobacter sp.]
MAAKADTSMTIRMNREIKQEAQEIFSALGMDMTTAINVFLRQAIYFRGFPFDVRLGEPNAETCAAFEEGERMLHDPAAPRFSSVDALFADLDAR